MKLSVALLAPTLIAAALVGAGSASAAAPGPSDLGYGSTICNQAVPQRCETPQQGNLPDGGVWTFEWGTVSDMRDAGGALIGIQQQRHFRRFAPWRIDYPYINLDYSTATLYATGAVQLLSVSITDTPAMNSPQCGTLLLPGSGASNDDGTPITYPAFEGAYPGLDGNPKLRHQCFPAVFDASGVWIHPAKPAAATPAVAAPAKAAACAPITVAKKRVSVTSTGLGCMGARNMLAKYMMSGVEPDGWVCSKLAVGKAHTASCGTPHRSLGKRVVGRWRS